MAAYALYVGGEVIHAFSMDSETAELAPIAAPTTAAGGGFMAFSADWNTLCILRCNAILSVTDHFCIGVLFCFDTGWLREIHCRSRYTTDNPAGAAAFRVLETGALEHIHTVPTLLQGNAHIAVVTAGGSSAVVLSSYGSGGVNILKVNPDTCGLEEPVEGTQRQHVGGSGAHPTRQAGPHPHSNFVDPSGTRVLVSDLGQDKIYQYAVDVDTGTLTEERVVETAPAAGPRHCVFSPSGEWVYGINELDCTINAYHYNAGDGTMSPAQTTVSTLPEGYENVGPPNALNAEGGVASATNTTADIHVTPDGRFLYGSNRGHDSIVCFEIDPADGSQLRLVGWTPTYGAHPRNFGIHPSGKWLIVANQNSDTIVLFRMDPTSGVLTREGDPISVEGKPRCIKFRPV